MLGTQGDPQELPHAPHTIKLELCLKAHTAVQHKCFLICPSVCWVSCEMLSVFMKALLMSIEISLPSLKSTIQTHWQEQRVAIHDKKPPEPAPS